jgi:LAO/AO transport system kinase
VNPSTANTAALAERIRAGDPRSLARAATLVENLSEAGASLISTLFPHTGRAMLIGITGPPGAGKSTLVDQLIGTLRRQAKTVGVLAIDPSSPFSHGALLGDRLRMQQHHADPGVFIRSLATRGKLGGLAPGTLGMALLLDAAGRDVVLIETVGAGQDETDIAQLADLTVVVLAPGWGDDLQAVKAGIMEIADVFVINKSDLPGAERLENEIRVMQSLADAPTRAAAAPVRRTVSTDGRGVEELLATITSAHQATLPQAVQIDRWALRLEHLFRAAVVQNIPAAELRRHAEKVAARSEDPFSAVSELKRGLSLS